MAVHASSSIPFFEQIRELGNDEMGIVSPLGLAFSPSAYAFYVVEGEELGQPGLAQTEIVKLSSIGDYVSTIQIAAVIEDPINMTFDSKFSRLLILQSSAQELIEVTEGSDGTLDPATLKRHGISHLGLQNPQGIATDPASGHLFVLDSAGPRIVQIVPAADGSFAAATSTELTVAGDDLDGPRGLAMDPATSHLYVVSTGGEELFEFTQTGLVVAKRDLSAFGISVPQGMVIAPSADLTDDPGLMHLYLVDGGADADVSDPTTPEQNRKHLPLIQREASSTGSNALEDSQTIPGEFRIYIPQVMGNAGNPAGNDFENNQTSPGENLDNPSSETANPDESGEDNHFRLGGRMMEFSLVESTQPVLSAATTFTSQLIKTVDASKWNKPSPDPSGVVYVNSGNKLVIVDGEVEETVSGITHFQGANVWETSLSGDVIRSANISKKQPTSVPMTDEPTGIAWNPNNGHYYVTDDGRKRVFDLNPGSDGLIGTNDDTWTEFTTGSQNQDPEGVAYDPNNRRLYVIDGVSREVFIYNESGNLQGNFDVNRYGMIDPEGIDFIPASGGTLYIVDSRRSHQVVIVTTTSGNLIETIDISAATPRTAAGVTYAPASNGTSAQRLYIVDRGIDNNSDPRIIDGKVYEMTVPSSGPPPTPTPTPTPQPPVAENDSATTTKNTAVTINVAANDSDPNGNLNPNSANSDCANNSSSGCNGAAHGSLTDNGNGTITYTPNTDYTGPDSFVYEICDTTSPTLLCDTATVNVTVVEQPVVDILYVTSTSGGNVGGVAFKDEDILAYDRNAGTWSLYFDGSDVGLGASGQEIDAFHVNADGSILLSLGNGDTLFNVGSVDDHDIVKFIPTSTGANTAGSYQLYFDGEDVGLTTSGEDIDAMGFAPDGKLVISTRGSFNVPGVTGLDEDLIIFTGTFGANTSGTWAMYFDGSDVGLDTNSSEDVAGTSIDANGDIYLSFRGAFSVAGLSGDGADIVKCTPGSTGPNTSCTFSLFWDGSANGFAGEILNGFSLEGTGGQSNSPPVAQNDSSITSQDTAVTVDVAANDSDPNGNLNPDSANSACATCADPANGTLTDNIDGTITYDPNSGYVGNDNFVYEICDTEPLCDTATVNIEVTVANDPPVAVNDTATTDEDSMVLIDVDDNDTDPNGNLDATTTNTGCTACSTPANGTLVNNINGTFDYTPNQDFNGSDNFVYEICDDLGACSNAPVAITVSALSDPPLAVDDLASTIEGTSKTIDVAANDSDPDGNLNSASANTNCTNVCTPTSNGSLLNNGDGTFDYIPNPSFTGSDNFVYEICDDESLCDTATVTITVSVSAPTVLEVRVAANSGDDAEEQESGNIKLSSSDLEMVQESSVQTVGMRFNAITIPQGANIIKAWIQFQADETHSDPTNLMIYGEAADNAQTFVNTDFDISSRPKTTGEPWSPPAWDTKGEAGSAQKTTDIAPVIQQIVNRDQWNSGNSLVIIITGTGKRVAESSNGDAAGAPLLHIEYSSN